MFHVGVGEVGLEDLVKVLEYLLSLGLCHPRVKYLLVLVSVHHRHNVYPVLLILLDLLHRLLLHCVLDQREINVGRVLHVQNILTAIEPFVHLNNPLVYLGFLLLHLPVLDEIDRLARQ